MAFNSLSTPYVRTIYMLIKINSCLVCKESNIWDKSWLNMVCIWFYLGSIQVIHDWMTPMPLTKICILFGLTNFYYKFMLGFSHISWPLIQVIKGGTKTNFIWANSNQKEFEDLKHYACLALVLTLVNLKQPFEIEIDALDYVVGAVLTQLGHPVAYHRKTLFDVVHKYSTYDKELQSILQACHQ